MKISTVTVAVWLAFSSAAPPPAPPPAPSPSVKCCGKCNGTGMVSTGDGITRVWCSCPATCPCAKNRPKPTCTGSNCRVR